MPDDTSPTLTAEQLQEVADASVKVTDALQDQTEATNIAKLSLSDFKLEGVSGLGAVSMAIGSAADKTQDLSQQFVTGSKNASDMGSSVSGSLGKVKNLAEEATKALISTSGAFGNFKSKGTEELSSYSGSIIEETKKLAAHAGQNIPGLKGLTDVFNSPIVSKAISLHSDIYKSIDDVNDYRDSLMSLAATRGDLGKFLTETGSNFQNIDTLLQEDLKKNVESSKALGLTVSDIEKLNLQLAQIPGTANAVVQIGGKTGEAMKLLDASFKLAEGSGRSFKDVQDDLTKAMTQYGFTAQQAIDYSSRISEVSKVGNIPLATTKEIISSLTQDFRLYGDNVDAASRMSLQFFDSLQKSGTSIKDSENIIKNLGKSVENLSLSQKAFLSAQTGGPGGLLGGLQIEKLLSEGKMDEVFDKMRKTLTKKFNGRIMTLADVKTQEDASLFTEQRALLTQGPLGKIVGSDAEANKVLQAFKEGKTPEVAKQQLAATASEGALEPINIGKEKAARRENVLLEVNRQLSAGLKQAALEKGSKGITGLTYGITGNESIDQTQIKEEQRQQMQAASITGREYADVTRDGGRLASGPASRDKVMDVVKSTFSQFANFYKMSLKDAMNPNADKMARDEQQINMLQKEFESLLGSVSGNNLDENVKKTSQLKLPDMSGMVSKTVKASEQTNVIPKPVETVSLQKTSANNQPVSVDVSVKGVCIDCGKKMHEQSSQARVLNVAHGK